MLWPEKRDKDPILGDKVPGIIYRTTTTSYIKAPAGLPAGRIRQLLSWGTGCTISFPWLFSEGMVRIGPIPKGTPVSLLPNMRSRKRTSSISSSCCSR